MEVYHLVFYFVLLTAAACSSQPDAIAENTNSNSILDSQNRNCSCENGKCVTDNQGNSKCVCQPGFALEDEFTCKPCDCGSLGKCIFILEVIEEDKGDKIEYQKRCVCDVGHAEKDGVCVDCFCGENSACDFNSGERRCFCIEGYAEKDGVCTRCDCGSHGTCEYEGGIKKCECDKGYLELNGKCEECDCGDNGVCSFENDQPTCKCNEGFSVNNGKCKPCDCGSNSESCVFAGGVKQCKCKDRYAEKYGTCEECYCGDHSTDCRFTENKKTCSCLEGYEQKGERCEQYDACNDYVDRIIEDFKKDEDLMKDPYEIPERNVGVHRKVLFINYTGEAGIRSGRLSGLSTLRREKDVVVYRGRKTTLKLWLGVGALNLKCGGRLSLMGLLPNIAIEVKADLVVLEVHITANKHGDPVITQVSVVDVKGLEVKVTGLGPLSFFLGAYVQVVKVLFRLTVVKFIQSRLITLLDRRLKEYKIPRECLEISVGVLKL